MLLLLKRSKEKWEYNNKYLRHLVSTPHHTRRSERPPHPVCRRSPLKAGPCLNMNVLTAHIFITVHIFCMCFFDCTIMKVIFSCKIHRRNVLHIYHIKVVQVHLYGDIYIFHYVCSILFQNSSTVWDVFFYRFLCYRNQCQDRFHMFSRNGRNCNWQRPGCSIHICQIYIV